MTNQKTALITGITGQGGSYLAASDLTDAKKTCFAQAVWVPDQIGQPFALIDAKQC